MVDIYPDFGNCCRVFAQAPNQPAVDCSVANQCLLPRQRLPLTDSGPWWLLGYCFAWFLEKTVSFSGDDRMKDLSSISL